MARPVRIVTAALLLLPLLVAVGCSDDEDPSAEARAAEDNAQALCQKLFSCCTESELAALPFVVERPPATEEACVAFHKKVGLEFVALTEAERGAGRVALHVERNADCLTKIKDESCVDFHARLRRLHVGDAFKLCTTDVVEPLVADGAKCRLYLDCKGGACELPPGTSAGADAGPEALGTCKALPKDGKPCLVDGCAEGHRCDLDKGICLRLVAVGAACDADDACASGACRGGKCVSPGRCGG